MLFGHVLIRDRAGPAVLLVRRGDDGGPGRSGLQVEAMAQRPGVAEELRQRMRERNVFRGQMISLESTMWGQHTVKWLAGELSHATVVVLAGGSPGAAGPVFRLARELAPSLVVLEDVDLVAEERTLPLLAHSSALTRTLLGAEPGPPERAQQGDARGWLRVPAQGLG